MNKVTSFEQVGSKPFDGEQSLALGSDHFLSKSNPTRDVRSA